MAMVFNKQGTKLTISLLIFVNRVPLFQIKLRGKNQCRRHGMIVAKANNPNQEPEG